jgi:hypothetical protein
MSAPSFDPAVWASCELAKRVLLGIDAIVPNPLLLLLEQGGGGGGQQQGGAHGGPTLRLRPGSLAVFCFARYLRLGEGSPLADVLLDQETWDALVLALTTPQPQTTR